MILKSISLKNYRKFKNSYIEFPDGITGVIGLNGVGKSTLFEAMAWVLYGPIAARTSADEIKREGTENSQPCRVELDFIFDDNYYHIFREMSGKNLSISTSVIVNEKLVASGAESVNSFIRKKLGMDFKSFFTSIFARQKELNALSSMNASERRPLILKMLGINSLDEVIKEVNVDKRERKSLSSKLNSDLFDDKGLSKIEIYKTKIKSFENNKKKLNIKINELKNNIEVFKDRLKNDNKNYSNIKKKYEDINKRKDELEASKELFEKKQSIMNNIKNLNVLIGNRKKKIESEKKNLSTYFKRIDEDTEIIEQKIKTTNTKNQDFLKEIAKKNTLIDSIKKNISEINYKKMKIIEMGPNADCPTCERILGEQYNTLIKNFKNEENNKMKELEDYKNEIDKIRKKQDILTREIDALNKRRKYLNSKLTDKKKIETIISNLENEIEREKKEIAVNKKYIQELGKIFFDQDDFNQTKKIVKKLYSQYQIILDNISKKKDILHGKKIELERFTSDKKLISEKIENLNDIIIELKKNEKKIKEINKIIQNLEILSEIFISFRTYLISRIRPALSLYASEFFERLTDGKYHEIDLDENYNIKVYDNNNLYGIERFSGGEVDLANLCLRLAISEIITERSGGIFNFIILDEIFGSQDFIRRQNILNALNGLSSKFRQIFLITHIEDIKNYMENIILVNESEDGISSIKLE
jgi:exonuclease SbcC